MDSAFYRAHTARAVCGAGTFTLMGRRLLPLSCCHAALLEEIGSPFVKGGVVELADVEVFSRVCSERMPRGDFGDLDAGALRGRDLAQEVEVAKAFLAMCLESRPRRRQMLNGGEAVESGVPGWHYYVTGVLRKLHGVSRDELWYDWPVAEVLWLFDGIAEQESGLRLIENAEDLEPMPAMSEAELEGHARVARVAQEAGEWANAEHALAREIEDDAERRRRHEEIEAEKRGKIAKAVETLLQHPIPQSRDPASAGQARGRVQGARRKASREDGSRGKNAKKKGRTRG